MSGEKCPSIIGLQLDHTSISAINELKQKAKLLTFVGKTISFSSLVDMFFARKVPTVAVNISQHEWELFAESMVAVPKIYRHEIVRIATQQELRLYKDQKQQKFWKGVRNGCSF